MDLNSLLTTMLSPESVSNLSQTAGVSPAQVQSVLGSAMPSLLNGALAQSQGSDTAESFANALAQHAGDDTGSMASFFQNVDMADGGKIVSHLLGGDGQALSAIAGQSGVDQRGTANVLSAAAPLLLSLLGQQTQQTQQTQPAAGLNTAGLMGALLQNVDMGSLLTGLLGGGQTQTAASDTLHLAQEQQPQQQSSGLFGLLGNLFK